MDLALFSTDQEEIFLIFIEIEAHAAGALPKDGGRVGGGVRDDVRRQPDARAGDHQQLLVQFSVSNGGEVIQVENKKEFRFNHRHQLSNFKNTNICMLPLSCMLVA